MLCLEKELKHWIKDFYRQIIQTISNHPEKSNLTSQLRELFPVALIAGCPIKYCQASIIFGVFRPILLSGNYCKAILWPPFNFWCGRPA